MTYFENTLKDLAKKHKTDKDGANHTYMGKSYLDVYESWFAPKRKSVEKIIEIGILGGHSLRLWEEYFPNAEIYGIDIQPHCKKFESERIKIFIGDQNDEDFLKGIASEVGPFDILLDDRSHIIKHQIKTFDILYPNLKSQGLYIIEDLRCTYEEKLNHHDLRKIWPGMSLNDKDDDLKNFRKDFINFVENKVKKLDFHEHKELFSIHHYPEMIIFENL